MIISKTTYQKDDVVSIKMSNGDELVARFESDESDHYVIKNPMAITIANNGIGMMPWLFLADGKSIKLNKSHVLCLAPTRKEAASQYMQSTTGLTLI